MVWQQYGEHYTLMSEDNFNKFIKPLADKWADDIVKDGLVNEDGTIPMSEWKNMSEEARTYNYDKDYSKCLTFYKEII